MRNRRYRIEIEAHGQVLKGTGHGSTLGDALEITAGIAKGHEKKGVAIDGVTIFEITRDGPGLEREKVISRGPVNRRVLK